MKEKKFDLELFFNALADRTRLRLLNLMGSDEICVCFFVDVIETNQPKISRHLAYLRRAGIVSARREGKWVHYKIVRPSNEYAAKILDVLLESFTIDEQMQIDRSKLANVCCNLQLPIKPIELSRREQPVYLLD
ncbi:MAG: metalloregulator ArsR/SmtB family transcription factor [Acidobacteria bacterium]|nr:metalloregulator ArsR/SmtB family transcription factor [Acidobacteriota bacterium]